MSSSVPEMLDRARARIARAGWTNLYVLEADVCELRPDQLGEPFDAALCTLGLSVIPDWRRAWSRMLECVRPGGRVAVMDAGDPEPGARRIDNTAPRPVAWALERLFAADCTRRPWRLLERDTHAPTSRPFTWGWVTAAAGTKGNRVTPLIAEAHVPTPNGAQYLADLCRQLEQRAQERPGHDMSVGWKELDGTIELGWARGALTADETGLFVHAEADDKDALEQVCELIARHLETHADEPIVVTWSHLGSSDAAEHRRDRMRAFHARMRHED